MLFQPAGKRLAQPRWSPDGTSLVFMKHTEVGGERLVLGNRGETILRLARSYLWPTLWKLGVYRGATEFGGDWRVVLVADILK